MYNKTPQLTMCDVKHRQYGMKYVGQIMKIKNYMDQPNHVAVEHDNMENNI